MSFLLKFHSGLALTQPLCQITRQIDSQIVQNIILNSCNDRLPFLRFMYSITQPITLPNKVGESSGPRACRKDSENIMQHNEKRKTKQCQHDFLTCQGQEKTVIFRPEVSHTKVLPIDCTLKHNLHMLHSYHKQQLHFTKRIIVYPISLSNAYNIVNFV